MTKYQYTYVHLFLPRILLQIRWVLREGHMHLGGCGDILGVSMATVFPCFTHLIEPAARIWTIL